MGFLDRFRRAAPEKRGLDAFVGGFLAQRPASAGSGASNVVIPENVLSSLGVASACVSLRSQMLASVPIHLYRRLKDKGREKADDLALYDVLHDMWGPNHTSFEGRELLVRCLDMHGNAYFRIERDGAGQVRALHYLHPLNVHVELLPSGRLRYRASQWGQEPVVLLQEEVLHVRGPSRNGIIGLSPIAWAAGSVGQAMDLADFTANYFANSGSPDGFISYPNVFQNGNGQADSIREYWANRFSGGNRFRGPAVLDQGGRYETISVTAEDAQLIESRKFSNEDIARIFGVPPTCVGLTDKATYNNVENEALALMRNCVGPLAARIEAAMARCLLTPQTRRQLYIEHDLQGLLRGDVKARFEAYRLGREIGVYSSNDVRRRENEPPIEGGDIYNQPANWTRLGSEVAPTGTLKDQAEPPEPKGEI